MAKVFGPLHSDKAFGQVAKGSVHTNWNGRSVVRGYAKPKNNKTTAQGTVRTKLAVPGKINKVIGINPLTPSDFYTEIKALTPSSLAWNSYLAKQILGTALAVYDTTAAAYAGLSGTIEGYYEAAAATAGLFDFSLGYGSITTVTAGEQLFHLYTAAYGLHMAVAPTAPDAVSAGNLTTFIGTLV